MPTRFYEPSPYLHGTDEDGPLGQLVAVISAERRGWFSDTSAYVGVSAVTGTYRFIDLPDLAPGSGTPALAPDGRHLAYWYTGAPPPGQTFEPHPAAGIAVYDTTTGEVVRRPVPSEHGIAVRGNAGGIVWLDARHLAYQANLARSAVEGELSRAFLWTLGSDARTSLGTGVYLHGAFTDGEGLAVASGPVHDVLLRSDGTLTNATLPSYAGGAGLVQGVVPSPGGGSVAYIRGDAIPGPLCVATLRNGTATAPRRVTSDGRIDGVVGWTGAEHLVVVRQAANEQQVVGTTYHPVATTYTLDLVDVRTGAIHQISDLESTNLTFALNLLGAPLADFPAPPRPESPWLAPSVAAGLTLLSGLALVWWWRRRRARP